MTKDMYELACAYRRCFTETADGKQILDDLKKGYCRNTVFHPEATAMAFLEGHRDVVLRIDHLIEAASKRLEDILEEDEDAGGNEDGYFNKSGDTGHYL